MPPSLSFSRRRSSDLNGRHEKRPLDNIPKGVCRNYERLSQRNSATTTPVVKDPVCGMDVDPATSPYSSERDGQTYHFCSGRRQANSRPALTYLVPHADQPGQPDHHEHGHGDHEADHEAGATAAAGEATEWTCPMHPEIRRSGPISRPICAMALEPATVTADSGPSPELADMTRRF